MSAMVTAVVGKGQHKLKQPFEYNKKMLKLDSTDHRFVQYVYDLKPNKQQIRSIRNIWKAIYNKKKLASATSLKLKCGTFRHFFYRQRMEKIIERAYNRLYNENVKNLTDYMFSMRDTHAIEYFAVIKNLLQQLYTKPMPKKLERHARYMYKMIKSMPRQLCKANIAV
ncbi:unnamed protein product [Rotaria sp. Silwood1]|nr:unnamed protein product [Rotaria sp. Silwood1]